MPVKGLINQKRFFLLLELIFAAETAEMKPAANVEANIEYGSFSSRGTSDRKTTSR